MSGFGYNVLGFGGGGPPPIEVDDEFNRVSFLSHFDGANNGVNNVIDDGSASNHTMTAQGVGLIGQGSFSPFSRPDGEWAVSFSGSATSDITGPTSSDFQFGDNSFTVECFIFPTLIRDYCSPITCIASSGAGRWYITYGANSMYWGTYGNGSNGDLTVTHGMTANDWYHLAYVRNKSDDKGRLYINGVQKGVWDDARTYGNPVNPVRLGRDTGTDNNMHGLVSNVRVVNGTAVYTSNNFTPPTSPLTAITNTKLLTLQSNRIIDNSASAHVFGSNGNTAVSALGPFLTDAVYDPAVNLASAFFTRGTNTAISTPDGSDFDLGATFTLEAWVYAYTAPDYANICGRWYDGSNDARIASHYIFQLYPDSGGPQLSFGTPLNFNQLYGSAFPIGEWVHVAVTQDGTTKRLFQNGIMGTTYSNPTTMSSSGNRVFSVGAHDGSNAQDGSGFKDVWDGHICDLRVLKGTALYTSNFTPPTAPLTAITNTKLLLNMADGQAIDSAAQNNLVLIGDAKLSTGQAKFGDTSLYINGSDTAAQVKPSNFRFGTGDFTIEFWYYGTTVVDAPLLDMRLSANNEARVSIFFTNNSGNVGYFATNATRITSNTTVATNTWTHIALVRSSAVTRFYFNGTQDNQTYSDTIDFLSSPLTIGLKFNLDSNNNVGYYDDVRISNMARYTASFAPTKAPDQGQI